MCLCMHQVLAPPLYTHTRYDDVTTPLSSSATALSPICPTNTLTQANQGNKRASGGMWRKGRWCPICAHNLVHQTEKGVQARLLLGLPREKLCPPTSSPSINQETFASTGHHLPTLFLLPSCNLVELMTGTKQSQQSASLRR